MIRAYKSIGPHVFDVDNYTLVPIRYDDRNKILLWRNEQINILRQKKPLTQVEQDKYFTTVIDNLFEEDHPSQLLWSLLYSDNLIGYGGLVHIDWESRNAEISFLTEPNRARDSIQFANDWTIFLKMLYKIAYLHLDFQKIFTYSYGIRTDLFPVLESFGFIKEATLKNHIVVDNFTTDVCIHSFFFRQIKIRRATILDIDQYYYWANDLEVRNNSYKGDLITLDEHQKWFSKKILSKDCFLYYFTDANDVPVGQVRIECIHKNDSVIGVSVDKSFRTKYLGSKMVLVASNEFLKTNPTYRLIAFIKVENKKSYKTFINAGFTLEAMVIHEGINSYKMVKKNI